MFFLDAFVLQTFIFLEIPAAINDIIKKIRKIMLTLDGDSIDSHFSPVFINIIIIINIWICINDQFPLKNHHTCILYIKINKIINNLDQEHYIA